MTTPEQVAATESLIEHMKSFHGCPDCFDPDMNNPELAAGMHHIHDTYHSGKGPSANFGGEMKPHMHERIAGVFNDRRTS